MGVRVGLCRDVRWIVKYVVNEITGMNCLMRKIVTWIGIQTPILFPSELADWRTGTHKLNCEETESLMLNGCSH